MCRMFYKYFHNFTRNKSVEIRTETDSEYKFILFEIQCWNPFVNTFVYLIIISRNVSTCSRNDFIDNTSKSMDYTVSNILLIIHLIKFPIDASK